MGYGPELQKIILLAAGCYLFAIMAQTQTSHARSHRMIEAALQKLSHVDLRAISVGATDPDAAAAALITMQP